MMSNIYVCMRLIMYVLRFYIKSCAGQHRIKLTIYVFHIIHIVFRLFYATILNSNPVKCVYMSFFAYVYSTSVIRVIVIVIRFLVCQLREFVGVECGGQF